MHGGKREGAGRKPGDIDKQKRYIQTEARKHAEKAINALVKNLDDTNANVRNVAAKEILDRAYGKAPQAITGEDGGPLQINITKKVLSARTGD